VCVIVNFVYSCKHSLRGKKQRLIYHAICFHSTTNLSALGQVLPERRCDCVALAIRLRCDCFDSACNSIALRLLCACNSIASRLRRDCITLRRSKFVNCARLHTPRRNTQRGDKHVMLQTRQGEARRGAAQRYLICNAMKRNFKIDLNQYLGSISQVPHIPTRHTIKVAKHSRISPFHFKTF
jgi:hypothetical protein